jgi:tellurite resistance protein TerC
VLGVLEVPLWLWGAFAVTVVVSLAVDLLSHRKAHVIGFKEAAAWSGVWVSLAMIFGAVVFLVLGTGAGTEYTTAWLLEKSLSVDNLFVFAVIFAYFKVPRAYQHRVLFFGVIGALVFRGIFLSLGVAVVSRFTAVLFVFAAVLFYSTYKLLKGEEDTFDPGRSFAVRLLRKIVPVQDEYAGAKFFVKEAGKRVATPLLAVVAAIEAADLIFAVDSVPAVLAVSDDAFIVYTSNAFAILGLRALYFMLAGLLDRFHYLSKGLAIILAFIGVKLIFQASHKMISPSIPEIPSLVSLGVIVVDLTASVVLSLKRPAPADPEEQTDDRRTVPAGEGAEPTDPQPPAPADTEKQTGGQRTTSATTGPTGPTGPPPANDAPEPPAGSPGRDT